MKSITVNAEAQYTMLGQVIDAEAALGLHPHPAIRSVVTANAAAAAILRELLTAPNFWLQADQIRSLVDHLERANPPAPAPTNPEPDPIAHLFTDAGPDEIPHLKPA